MPNYGENYDKEHAETLGRPLDVVFSLPWTAHNWVHTAVGSVSRAQLSRLSFAWLDVKVSLNWESTSLSPLKTVEILVVLRWSVSALAWARAVVVVTASTILLTLGRGRHAAPHSNSSSVVGKKNGTWFESPLNVQ